MKITIITLITILMMFSCNNASENVQVECQDTFTVFVEVYTTYELNDSGDFVPRIVSVGDTVHHTTCDEFIVRNDTVYTENLETGEMMMTVFFNGDTVKVN